VEPDLPLIGRGRDADVYDLGDGRVLRRYRGGRARSVDHEVTVMRHLHERGAPVPAVFDVDGTDLVLQRLNGPTMLTAVQSRPWTAASLGRQLAEVQRRILAVPADGLDLPVFEGGDGDRAVLHFDLHPDNVMLTADGPMVIDWTNAAVGPAAADVLNTWMVMATSIPTRVAWYLRPAVRTVRAALLRGFLDGAAIDDVGLAAAVCARRLRDPNLTDAERDNVRAWATARSAD
jgi:aminoglycoside phosphotransferase (APT) family kinase protein